MAGSVVASRTDELGRRSRLVVLAYGILNSVDLPEAAATDQEIYAALGAAFTVASKPALNHQPEPKAPRPSMFTIARGRARIQYEPA